MIRMSFSTPSARYLKSQTKGARLFLCSNSRPLTSRCQLRYCRSLAHQATRASRPGALTHTEAVEYVYSLQRFHIEPITAELVLKALTIRERFGVSYWDAAVLAAAQITGCDVVYSEDLSHTPKTTMASAWRTRSPQANRLKSLGVSGSI